MSCISSNFSSFFLNSLNDSSEFAKYLSNGELRFSSFEDFQVFGTEATSAGTPPPTNTQQLPSTQQAASQQLQQQQYYNGVGNGPANVNVGVNGTPIQSAGGLGASVNGETYNGVIGQTQNLAETSANAVLAATSAAQHTAVQQQTLPHGAHMQPTHVPHTHHTHHAPSPHTHHPYAGHAPSHTSTGQLATNAFHPHHNHHTTPHLAQGLPTSAATSNYPTTPQRWPTSTTTANGVNPMVTATPGTPHTLSQLQNSSSNNQTGTPIAGVAAQPNPSGAQHFDGSFEFLKYLRHSNDYNAEGQAGDAGGGGRATPQPAQTQASTASSLIDLDSSTAHKSRSSRKAAALLSSVSRASNSLDANTLDVFDHDSKHTIFDMQHVNATSGSNSNESSLEVSNLAFPSSHLNASNSNTSSEGAATGNSDFTMLQSGAAASAPKPLATFTIKENFEAHPSHKVEEGIFQHMNKLPAKKKETLKQLGVRFTGQMTWSDKSIIVDNFVKFCEEYDVQDHRPFLSLNQSGLNKADQIKFARYLGQGLPTFTLFCIYSNFKNLFCTKRTEIYMKDGYNLPYIIDKTKRFLSSSTADLKNMMNQQSNDGMEFGSLDSSGAPRIPNSLDAQIPRPVPKVLESLMIFENFDVHETHRVEDGVCTHITRLPPKKQEIFKQFGIQSNQVVTFYEKYIIIENFSKFCNEYKISDHRPFLDFHESGLPKCEQVKFVRYLGQGLPNLTLNKIYLSFKELLGMSRMEKANAEGYNLETILKKKKKIFYNRVQAAVQRESSEQMQTSSSPVTAQQQTSVKPTPQHSDGLKT